MTTHIARKVVQSFREAASHSRPPKNLSGREQESLTCLSQGFLYKEIAEKLGISLRNRGIRIFGASTRKLQVRHPY